MNMAQRIRWFVISCCLALMAGAMAHVYASPDAFEPNNTLAEAPVIPLETPVSATIFPTGDQDFYRVPIATGLPLQLDVSIDEVASNLNLHLTVFDGNKQELFRHEAPVGQPLRCLLNLADPGSLTLQIVDSNHGINEVGYSSEWNNQAATQPYRLTVRATPMPDPNEPNNTLESACQVGLDAIIRGRLFPARDEDWFKVTVPTGKRGLLKIVFTHPSDLIQPTVLLRDSGGHDLDFSQPVRGTPAVVMAEVASGTYFFRLLDGHLGKNEVGYSSEWGNQCSIHEYQVSVRFLEVTDEFEPSSQAVPATITANTEISAALFPRGDTDFYTLEIPAPGVGVLNIEADCSQSPVVPVLHIMNPQGREFARTIGPEAGICRLSTNIRAPGRYVIGLFDHNSGTWEVGYSSEIANRNGYYRLRTSFSPVSDSDDSHTSHETALALPANDVVRSFLFPEGEQEFYRLTVPGSGPTIIELSCPDLSFPIAPALAWMRAPNEDERIFRVGNHQPLTERLRLPAPGSFTFRIFDGNHGLNEVGYSSEIGNRCSTVPYHVSWRILPPPPAPTASSSIPCEESRTASAARTLTLPASFSFYLYPSADQEWLLLKQFGPGLLEGRFDALDLSLNPMISVFCAASSTDQPFLQINNSDSSIEHFRVLLPYQSDWLFRVSASTGSSSCPIHAQLWSHDIGKPSGPPGTTPAVVADLQAGCSNRILPKGDIDTWLLPFAGQGILRVSGFDPDGISLQTTFHAYASQPLKVLYLVGGRTDYSLFGQYSASVVATRLQEDSREYLSRFPFYSGHSRHDCPLPEAATTAFSLSIPDHLQYGRLVVTGFAFDRNNVRFTCNGHPLIAKTIAEWGGWAEVAYEIASLTGVSSLSIELDAQQGSILLAHARFDAWTGSAPLSLPLPPFQENPLPRSFWKEYDAIVIDGLNHPNQFFLNRPPVRNELEKLASEGRRIVIVCPQHYNYSLFSAHAGGTIAVSSPELQGPPQLIDGSHGPHGQSTAWYSGTPPGYVVLASPGEWPVLFNRVIIQSTDSKKPNQMRTVLLEASMESPTTGFQRLGEYTLEPGKRFFDCRFPIVGARYLRVTALAQTGASGFHIGECEVYGPGSVFGHYGVLHQSEWRNDTVQAVSMTDEMVSGRDSGDPNHWPASENNGCWIGWREAGYKAAFVDTEDPDQLGITVYKSLGKGMIILETQELSYSSNLSRSFWKMNNYLDLPPNPVQQGSSNACFNVSTAGLYHLAVQASDKEAWSPAPYTLRFQFVAASDTYEPNQTLDTACRIASDIHETLFPWGDRDWWLYSTATPSRLLLYLENRSLSLDPQLSITAQNRTDRLPARFSDTCRHGFGADECGTMIASAPGLYACEIRDAFPHNRSSQGYYLSISEKPINRSFEPNDTSALATRLDSGVMRRAGLFPDSDRDWFVLDMATGTLDLTLTCQAEDLDPQIGLYRPFRHKNGIIPVLYLVGGMKSWHTFDQFFEVPFQVTRIDYDDPRARNILHQLNDFLIVVIDGVTDPSQFELFSPDTQRRLEDFARSGGHVIVTCPSVTFSEARQSVGGKIIGSPGSWDERWIAENLNDGYVFSGNDSFLGPRGWCCKQGGATFPQEIVLALPSDQTMPLNRIILRSTAQTPDRMIRDFELFISTPDDPTAFERIGSYTLQQTEDPQAFPFAEKRVSRIKLVIHSNWGSPDETQIAELEALASSSEKLLFGMKLVQLWQRNQAVEPAGPSPALPTHTKGPFQHQPHHDTCGWLEGCQEAGFTPILVHVAATESRAITVFRRIGSGTMVVDMQNFGHRDQHELRWKFYNLCDQQPPLIRQINNTCGGGSGAPERCAVNLAGGRYFLQVTAADKQGALDGYTLIATFPESKRALPLILCGTEPGDGLSGLHPDCGVRLSFNQPPLPSSLRPDQISLMGEQSGTMAWEPVWKLDENALFLQPRAAQRFVDGEQVVLKVGRQALTAEDGSFPATDTTISFRIGRTTRTNARLTIRLSREGALGIGKHEIIVTATHALKQPPSLKCTYGNGKQASLVLTPITPLSWQGTWEITADTPQGTARLTATAVTESGDQIPAPTPLLVDIDTQPPSAPANAPTVRAVAGGQVEISWAAPSESLGVSGYIISRATGGGDIQDVARIDQTGVLSHLDATPREALWEYRLSYLDSAGNRSQWSPATTVDTDRTPPATAPGSFTFSLKGPRINLKWSPVREKDVVGYHVFRLPTGKTFSLSQFAPTQTIGHNETATSDQPGDGDWTYYVAARDRAGNIGPVSPCRVLLDTTPAWAHLQVSSVSPFPPVVATQPMFGRLPPGTISFIATLSEPVRQLGSFAVRLADQSTVPGEIDTASGVSFSAHAVLPEHCFDGPISLVASAVDLAGNHGLTIHHEQLILDTASPSIHISWHPDQPMLIGTVTVYLIPDEPVIATPSLSYRLGETITTVGPLSRRYDGVWMGSICLGTHPPDGEASFLVSGSDVFGRIGARITAGATFFKDSTPPDPPRQLMTTSAAGGGIRLTWQPPVNEVPAHYSVYRSLATDVSQTAEMRIATTVQELEFVDSTATGTANSYRVSATDRAGNEGQACPSITGISDTTPPPPPEGAKAEIMNNGQVAIQWQKPRLEDAARYRIVREYKSRNGTVSSEKIYEDSIPRYVDLPRLQGEISYRITALDEAGNESPPTQTATLSYDLTPPTVKGLFTPSFGRRMIPIYGLMSVTWKDLGEVVRPGPLDITLQFDEPMRDLPKLTWRTSIAETPQLITLTRKTDSYFVGRIVLPRCPGQDVDVRFTLEAADMAGNLVKTLGDEARLLLDSEPPAAINQFKAEPAADGRIHCTWAPPGKEPEGEPEYRLYRSEEPFNEASQADLIVERLKETTFTDRPPRDGIWYYAVAAVDRAGYVGSLTPAVAANADATPPVPPASLGVRLGREIVVSWAPAQDADTLDWQVYLASFPIDSVRGPAQLKPAAEGLTEPRFSFVPPAWPTIHVAVAARDRAGNLAFTRLDPPLAIQDKLPSARIRVEPPPPARGAVRVIVETSMPVREVPQLWFEPSGHQPLSLALASDPTSAVTFSTTLPITDRTGDGTGTFRFLGRSRDDFTGTEITSGRHLVIDTQAPSLNLSFPDGIPLRAGKVPVHVKANEPLAEAPSLSLIPQGGAPLDIILNPTGPGAYAGECVISDSLPDGQAYLKASGRDLAGNVTSRIEPDRVAIDNHPPASPTVLAGVTRKHGTIELRWQPPRSPLGGDERLREYVVYRSDRPFSHPASATVAARVLHPAFIDGSIPADGNWYYSVAAVDEAGWISSLSAQISVRSDRTPPPVPASPVVTAGEAHLTIAWAAVSDGASNPVTYEVRCESVDPLNGRMRSENVFGPGIATAAVHRPLYGGDLKYLVRAIDSLGHESTWSAPGTIHYERQSPAATLQFKPAAPWASGTISVQLTSTRPLVEMPKLSLLSIDRTASAPASATAIPLKGAGATWQGQFVLPDSQSVTDIEFSWIGTSSVSGKALAGTDLLSPKRFAVDRLGPEGRIQFGVDVPQKDRQAILKAGRYPFTLILNEPVTGVPQLSFEAEGGKRRELSLTPSGEQRFDGVLTIDEKTGDGLGHFFLKAVDPAGNIGTSIEQGGVVLIDTTPPGRVARIRAVSYPGGKVRIDWTPPQLKNGRPDTSANRFHLYRSSQEIIDIRGLSPIQMIHRQLGAFDHPTGSRKVYYAVTAADEAGNVGPLSLNAMTSIDAEPPAPPKAVSARIMENGVIKVTWEPPPGEIPAMYNVYLEKFPIVSVAGLTPNARGVPFTYLYGTPNDDGRYYFAVTAVDGSLNESQPSETVSVDYIRTLPIAGFTILPDIWLRDGVFDVRLDTSKPLVEAPLVEVKHEKGLSFPLRFTGSETKWSARLTIDQTLPEGTCGFAFTGKGTGNTIGREIARGPLFHIDRTPPLSPSNLRVVPDDTNTPGAVKISWNSPKRSDQSTEVPHFYRLYRSSRKLTSTEGLLPIHEYRVQYQNLDEYVYHDMPPTDGTWHYCITSLDLAGNESVPSADSEVVSSTLVPRLSVRLFTSLSGNTPVDRLGSGTSRIEVLSSQPLASLTLSWYEITRDEKLAGVIATRTPIIMKPRESGISSGSRLWEGSLTFDRPVPVELEAAFEASAVSVAGQVGTFIGSGKTFFVDTIGPEARIRIPSISTMRIDAASNTLVVAPVTGGMIEVTVETLGELYQPPDLAWAFEGSEEWQTIVLKGFGDRWSGFMNIPQGIASAAARFRYRGVDRMGNVSTIIEKRTYERKLDEDCDPPRTLESYATTGGVFDIDSVSPQPPRNVRVDQKQLGIAVIKWDEGPGEPKSFNLYRSLTPIVSRQSLSPVKTGIFAPIIVDDPPVDGNYFYAVTQLDMAGNESEVSESRSIFIDSIKPELKIRAVPSGEDFIILADEEEGQTLSVELRFPGGKTMQVELGGSSGELEEIAIPGETRKRRGKVLPQILQQFNGTVEIIVHSPDPAGNKVEQITSIETRQIPVETGGDIQSVDQKVTLEVPAGMVPVIPKGPNEFQRVGGYQNLFFIRHENIPAKPVESTASAPADPKEPDPLPPTLEVVGTPYRIELNVNTEKPMELRASASQADFSQLKELTAKLRMKIPDLGSDAVNDTNYLASRLKVVKWVPMTADEAAGVRKTDKRGRWEIVPDIEISTATREIIAPARDITTYVIVSERTPPSIVDLEPAPESTVKTFRPTIKARLIDKGTGIAQGAENRVLLHIDGMPADPARLSLSTEAPTEVTLSYEPSTDLAPGAHIITIKAQDVVENQAVRRWRFVIDNEPPRISSILPAENVVIGLSRPVISAVTEDEGGGIDPDRLTMFIDDATLTPRFDAVTGRVVAFPPRPLNSGKHEIRALFEDRGGKKVSKTWNFTTDTDAPLISLVQPASSTPLANGRQPLIIEVSDTGAGVDPASLLLDLDGRLIGPAKLFDVSDNFTWDPVKRQISFAPTTGFGGGSHELLLSAGDRLGRFQQQRLRFVVDSGAPSLSFDQRIAGSPLGHLLKVREDLPGVRVQASATFRFDPYSGVILLMTEPGAALVTLTVLDAAGYSATSQFDPGSGELSTTVQSPIQRSRSWYPWIFLVAGVTATVWMWWRRRRTNVNS